MWAIAEISAFAERPIPLESALCLWQPPCHLGGRDCLLTHGRVPSAPLTEARTRCCDSPVGGIPSNCRKANPGNDRRRREPRGYPHESVRRDRCSEPRHDVDVLLMDPDGQRLWPVAGPRVPADWTQAISPLMIGPNTGSCGTAAFRKERVIISDIASDPLCRVSATGSRARPHSLMDSEPRGPSRSFRRTTKSSAPSGCFTATPRSPSTRELRLIEDAGHIAVIAIEGERSQAALKKAFVEIKASEDRLRTILDTIPTQAWSLRPDGTVDYLNQRWHEYTGLSREAYRSSKGEPGESDGTDLPSHCSSRRCPERDGQVAARDPSRSEAG